MPTNKLKLFFVKSHFAFVLCLAVGSGCAKQKEASDDFSATRTSSQFGLSKFDIISNFDSRVAENRRIEPRILERVESPSSIVIKASASMRKGQQSRYDLPKEYPCQPNGEWSEEGEIVITSIPNQSCSIFISVPLTAEANENSILGAIYFLGQVTTISGQTKTLDFRLLIGELGSNPDFQSPGSLDLLDNPTSPNENRIYENILALSSEDLALGEMQVVEVLSAANNESLNQVEKYLVLPQQLSLPVSWDYSYPDLPPGHKFELETVIHCSLIQNILSYGEPDVVEELTRNPSGGASPFCPLEVITTTNSDRKTGRVSIQLRTTKIPETDRYSIAGMPNLNFEAGAKNAILLEVTLYSNLEGPGDIRIGHLMRFPFRLNIIKQPKIEEVNFEFLGRRGVSSYYRAKTQHTFGRSIQIVDDINSRNGNNQTFAKIIELDNADEEQFINRFQTGMYWLGLTDFEEEGVWRKLSDGSIAEYFNWLSGEPNNRRGEHCAVGHFKSRLWNDLSCSMTPQYTGSTELFAGQGLNFADPASSFYLANSAGILNSSGANMGPTASLIIEVQTGEQDDFEPPVLVIR